MRASRNSENPGVSRRVLAGVQEVAWYAVLPAIIALVAYALEGDQIVRARGLTLYQVLLVYAAVTVATGVLFGLLKPLAKGVLSKGLVSIVVAWPASYAAMIFSRDVQLEKLDGSDLGASMLLALFVGPFAAACVHLRDQGRKE